MYKNEIKRLIKDIKHPYKTPCKIKNVDIKKGTYIYYIHDCEVELEIPKEIMRLLKLEEIGI